MPELFSPTMAGQIVGLVALVLCILAFSSKNDDRLLVILIFANIAFALQFALFEAWVASGISTLIIVRIVLARRLPGNWIATIAILLATILITVLNWGGPIDVAPLMAGLVGTVAMFMLRGIPMRLGLAGAALCWIVTNALVGSIGALMAEVLIFGTNMLTIWRLMRDRKAPGTPPAQEGG